MTRLYRNLTATQEWIMRGQPEPRDAAAEGDRMDAIEHWWCATCGTFDGPIGDGDDCDVCHDDGIGVAVERLVPAQQLAGAAEALEAVIDDLNELEGNPPALVSARQKALDLLDQLRGRSA